MLWAKSYVCGFFLAVFFSFAGWSQGHIEHIKNQRYMEIYERRPFDCANRTDEESTTLHDKICANLKFQKSDSLLSVVYDSLLMEMNAFGGDSLVHSFEVLQKGWRDYRAEHCEVIWDMYEGCGGCNTRAAHYMRCMRELTDLRTLALGRLLKFYREENGAR